VGGPYRVGVVGLGVAGAATAALLARAGHKVTVLERAPEVGPTGAGALLQPSGQRALARLGLAETVEELVAYTPRGRELVRLAYGDFEPGCHGLGVHRGDLFAALNGLVAATGVDVRLGVEADSFAPAGGLVLVRDAAGEAHGPFELVVAADGSRSALRARSGLVRWEHEYRYGALWAVGTCEAVRGRLHQVVRGTSRLVGLLPLGAGRCNLFWSLRHDALDALHDRGFDAWRREVVALCPEADELLSGLRGFEETRLTTYRHVVLRRPYADRLVLVGDACHAMSPHLGQGINLALLDALCLAGSLDAEPDLARALERYANERRAQVRYYARVTLALTPFFQSGGVVKGLGRDLALPVLQRNRWARRRMLLALSGLASGVRDQRLDV
jgi:2-polyprenyl-6-methoxyphenol hydroxylase-like FAD-dependent oxidoreductase